MMNEPQKRCFEWLCNICAARGVLPTSCVLEPGSLQQSDVPVFGGDSKCVWKGKFNDTSVAIKTVPSSDRQLEEFDQVRWLSTALDDNS